ncbi:MAG: hypothetical protein Unbinned4336contig1001_21 [Prokaryotic dsDNA virus sp.]|nr:MAG: hypothetical protein Unbinned4336contig1001_21 [Prokaryotic dsDNA virus sp.]|tara:strand:+ start:546 stop:770 length:225 start_codon:yes stop_codon:yes gene_type:complete
MTIKDTKTFQIKKCDVTEIRKRLKKTGLFKVGKVGRQNGIRLAPESEVYIEVENLYQFENWMTANQIIKSYEGR